MATIQDLVTEFKALYTDSGFVNPDLVTLLLHKISLNSGGGGGVANTVAIKDGAISTNTLTIDSSGRLTAIIAGTQRTPSFINTTTNGTIASGARKVNIANIGTTTGTVLGASLPASVSIPFEVNGTDTLSAITYDATGTNFLITVVV